MRITAKGFSANIRFVFDSCERATAQISVAAPVYDLTKLIDWNRINEADFDRSNGICAWTD
jgi:hypothetical protein